MLLLQLVVVVGGASVDVVAAMTSLLAIGDRSCTRRQLRSNIGGRASTVDTSSLLRMRGACAVIAAGIALLRHSSVVINVDQSHASAVATSSSQST